MVHGNIFTMLNISGINSQYQYLDSGLQIIEKRLYFKQLSQELVIRIDQIVKRPTSFQL